MKKVTNHQQKNNVHEVFQTTKEKKKEKK